MVKKEDSKDSVKKEEEQKVSVKKDTEKSVKTEEKSEKPVEKEKELLEKIPRKPKKEGEKGPFDWVEYKPKELEEVIINLVNSGHTSSQIGMTLRDQYGIPNLKKVLGKKVEQFLEEHKLQQEVPFDLLNLIRKSVKIEKHLKENKKDMTAKRGFILTVSKIRRLVKYYHKKGKLSKDWKYTSERAALLIK